MELDPIEALGALCLIGLRVDGAGGADGLVSVVIHLACFPWGVLT